MANCSAARQFRSVCTTTCATLRCTNTSPGGSPMISLAGTRLSEQPIHRYFGFCCCESRSKNDGSDARMRSDQSRLFWNSSCSTRMGFGRSKGRSRRRCDTDDFHYPTFHCALPGHRVAFRGRPTRPEKPLIVLVLGLLLFLGPHSVRLVADDWRSARIASMGIGRWKGFYSLVSIVGFVLIIVGYGMARANAGM